MPTRANGQPAFGAYLRGPTGISHGMGLFVLTLTGDHICAMTRFERSAPVVRSPAFDAQPVAAEPVAASR